MSRIGNQPIAVPHDVTISMDNHVVALKGSKGELTFTVPHEVDVKHEGEQLVITRKRNDKSVKSLHGYTRAELHNSIVGVTKGWTKSLELSGVGYRAALEGTTLVLTIGFSHQVKIVPPSGVTFAIVEGKIIVSGIDKQLVGQTAANIRAVKKPEPYKGKGIKYTGEYIRKKAGKSAKAIGGAPGGAAK